MFTPFSFALFNISTKPVFFFYRGRALVPSFAITKKRNHATSKTNHQTEKVAEFLLLPHPNFSHFSDCSINESMSSSGNPTTSQK